MQASDITFKKLYKCKYIYMWNKLTSLGALSIHEPSLPLNLTSKTNLPPFGGD